MSKRHPCPFKDDSGKPCAGKYGIHAGGPDYCDGPGHHKIPARPAK
jgi:hypothetical protein